MLMSRGLDERAQMHSMSHLLSTCDGMSNRELIDDGAACANLSVRAMVLSTFYHNTSMKAQAQRVTVPEDCNRYKRLCVFWCIIVTKVPTTDGDSLEQHE